MELWKYILWADSNGPAESLSMSQIRRDSPCQIFDFRYAYDGRKSKVQTLIDLIRHKDFNTDLVVIHEFLA